MGTNIIFLCIIFLGRLNVYSLVVGLCGSCRVRKGHRVMLIVVACSTLMEENRSP